MAKKSFLYAGILIGAVGITWALKAQQKVEDKKYKVEMTVQEWSIKLQYLDYVKQQLRVSDLPSKQVAFISDSLITPFQVQITQQIQKQMLDEQKPVKPISKGDFNKLPKRIQDSLEKVIPIEEKKW